MLDFDETESIIKLQGNIKESVLKQAVKAGKINIKVVLKDDKEAQSNYFIIVSVINSNPDYLKDRNLGVPPRVFIK